MLLQRKEKEEILKHYFGEGGCQLFAYFRCLEGTGT